MSHACSLSLCLESLRSGRWQRCSVMRGCLTMGVRAGSCQRGAGRIRRAWLHPCALPIPWVA
eukprot:1026790-Pelagomonas_calceolata.AAC.1